MSDFKNSTYIKLQAAFENDNTLWRRYDSDASYYYITVKSEVNGSVVIFMFDNDGELIDMYGESPNPENISESEYLS